jgi:hypothetical protein
MGGVADEEHIVPAEGLGHRRCGREGTHSLDAWHQAGYSDGPDDVG